jgi:hypothetical protein
MRQLMLGLLATAALVTSSACAYNATGSLPRRTLIFEATVEGPTLTQANNIVYYFVVDTDGNPETGPLVNGPVPRSFPYPDPRSYVPFVRDESPQYVLDREPVAVPPTVWQDYFWLTEEAGAFVMWQARRDPTTGVINERFRQLQNGREWGIKDGRTIQITLPFNQLSLANADTPPAQIEANLAVATRALGNDQRGFMIERWGRVQNTFFPIYTRTGNNNIYDTVSGVTFQENLGGVDPRSVNFTTVTYRVVFAD